MGVASTAREEGGSRREQAGAGGREHTCARRQAGPAGALKCGAAGTLLKEERLTERASMAKSKAHGKSGKREQYRAKHTRLQETARSSQPMHQP